MAYHYEWFKIGFLPSFIEDFQLFACRIYQFRLRILTVVDGRNLFMNYESIGCVIWQTRDFISSLDTYFDR